MSTKDEKQYGLILPGKNKPSSSVGIRKLNPLQTSDDELEKDEDSSLNWVEASLKKSAGNSGQQNLQKRLMREALEEDASVFQYDEIYDELQATKSAQIAAKKQAEEKKPKYIHNIMKQAEKRKLEGERRTERKVQKEREDEGDLYADKESFVTPSYLKKMEELKKAEVEAKLEEMREDKIDVLKHKNFGVFYNHLFKQKMGESEVKKEPTSDEEEDGKTGQIKKREDPKRQKHYRTQRDLSESPEREVKGRPRTVRQDDDSSDSEDEKELQSYRERREKFKTGDNKKDGDKGKTKERDEKSRDRGRSQERARDRGKSEKSRDRRHGREKSHERERNNRGRHRSRSRDHHRRGSRSKSPSNKRDDRRRRDSSRSRSPQRSSKNQEKTKIKEEPKSPERRERKEKKDESANQDRDDEIGRKANVKVKKENELEEKEKRLERIRKLFTKRTVGEKFDQALQRFYARKAEREANG